MMPHVTVPSLSETFQNTVSVFSRSFWDLVAIQGIVFFATLFVQAVLFPASASGHSPALRMLLWLASLSLGYTLQMVHLLSEQKPEEAEAPAVETLFSDEPQSESKNETPQTLMRLQRALRLSPGLLTLISGSAALWAASLAASVFLILPGALVWARLQSGLPAIFFAVQRARETEDRGTTTPLWVPVPFWTILVESGKHPAGLWKQLSLLAAAPWLFSVVFFWRLWQAGTMGPHFLEDLIVAAMLAATTAWLSALSSVGVTKESLNAP